MPYRKPFCRRPLLALGVLITALWMGVSITQAANAAPLVGPGDIAFVGYNADGNDDLAFVLLQPVDAGQTIFFTDKNWDGATFISSEGEVAWTAAAIYPAGTVITINNMTTGATTSAGTVLVSGALNLSGTNEALFAYIGASGNPTAFLAAIANDTFAAASSSLDNTGLLAGQTALELENVDADADIATYNGLRDRQTAADIHNIAYWVAQDGSGDQSMDTIAPDIPFDTTPFSAPTAVTMQQIRSATNYASRSLWLTAALLFVATAIAWRQQHKSSCIKYRSE